MIQVEHPQENKSCFIHITAKTIWTSAERPLAAERPHAFMPRPALTIKGARVAQTGMGLLLLRCAEASRLFLLISRGNEADLEFPEFHARTTPCPI